MDAVERVEAIGTIIEYAVNADPPLPVNQPAWSFASSVIKRAIEQGHLALARSNRDALDENYLIGAVLAHTRAVGGAIKCDISNAKFAIRQVLDRLPSPPDTGE